MKKTPPGRALPARPAAAKAAPAFHSPVPALSPDLSGLANDPLLTELRRLDAENASQLQQMLTADQYTRCQGESQQRMTRPKYPARR